MSRITSVKRNKTILWILFSLICFIGVNVYAVPGGERHTLILANEYEGNKMHILELKSTGEIVTTAHQTIYSFYEGIGVSPDQCFLWVCTYGGIQQYAISPTGQVTTTGRFIAGVDGSEIKFTPNGEMLLVEDTIYRAHPDGSIESTANRYIGTLYLSPRGDINIRTWGSIFYVDKIDYDTFSINSIQYILPEGVGASVYDVTYTPEGDYVAMTNRGGTTADVEIYPILANGMLDTNKVQRFDMGSNANPIVSSIDGRFLYVGYDDQLDIAILRRIYTSSGPYEDTGWRIPTGYWPWQMIVSPDGKYLVAHDMRRLQVFAIQDNGYLVPVGERFPFDTIFGSDLQYFQFAYPPAPTGIDTLNWELYQ